MRGTIFFLLAGVEVEGHGSLLFPQPRNHNGTIEDGGICNQKGGTLSDNCVWFSNEPGPIPGPPTLTNPEYRTIFQEIEVGSEADIFRTNPWRAPGTAPVFGSGCGMNGGGEGVYFSLPNSGANPDVEPSIDGAALPPKEGAVWARGSAQEVVHAITANHGGGYAYRLCSVDEEGGVSESCFQRTTLQFASSESFVVYAKGGRRVAFQNTIVREGTYPAGSEWMKGPIPTCRVYDDPAAECGQPVQLDESLDDQANSAWHNFTLCCAQATGSPDVGCGDSEPFFDEPVAGVSGWGFDPVAVFFPPRGEPFFDFSIADSVRVPEDLTPGRYLLSWRYDCEGSAQVWENCADISVV